MPMWEYADISRDPESVPKPRWVDNRYPSVDNCRYCKAQLEYISHERSPADLVNGIFICPVCGWWVRLYQDLEYRPLAYELKVFGAAASLRELDLTDIRTPVAEVTDYLSARYEARFDVHPRLWEETVASVLGSLGYKPRVTGHAPDDGIDIILDGTSDTIGVQVKRYKNAIEVEQIRSLAGALLLGGMTKGMFITTSKFQSGCSKTVEKYQQRGYTIELYDAARFYEALRIAQTTLDRWKREHRDLEIPVERFVLLDVRGDVSPDSP